MFIKKNKTSDKKVELFEKMSDVELLNKAGLLIKGKVTNAALILLGKQEAMHLFDGLIPRITWTLYNGDGTVKAYEHFDMPLLLAVDKVYAKIRNEKYRYIAGQMTLFPDEVYSYDADVVKEILNNCIAHSNYQLRGKINVEEFEDKLVFINEGNFIPETVERALEEGYKPPYYRNTFLCNAMVNLYMIDTNSMGIPMMYQIQRNKCFPLPSYDLEDPNRVKVTIYGRILDKNYTQLLHSNENLNLREVFILDKVQKHETISRDDFLHLKKQGFVEGRYPNIYVSFRIADIVGKKRNKSDFVVLILLGVMVMIVAMPTGAKQSQKETQTQEQKEQQLQTEDSYKEQLQQQLKELLEHMDGVGKTRVMLTFSDEGTDQLDKNVTKDGNKKEETTVVYDTGDTRQPYVICRQMPKIEGVVVVAQGGGNAKTVTEISNAVMSLFPVEAHKVVVVKMSVQEE